MRKIARTSAFAVALAVSACFAGCSGDDDDATTTDSGADTGRGGSDAGRDSSSRPDSSGGAGGSAGQNSVEAGADVGVDASSAADVSVDGGGGSAPDARTVDVAADARDAGAADADAAAALRDAEAGAVVVDAGARDADAATRDAEAGAVDAGARDADAAAVDAADGSDAATAVADAATELGDSGPVSTVVVNEINSSGTDFVELFNTGLVPVDVGSWTLSDDTPGGNGRPYTIPAGTTIAAGGYLAIYGTADGGFTFGLGAPDAVVVRDALGRDVLNYAWGSAARNTDSRCPNGTGDFSNGRAPTPGAANDCSE